MVENTLIQKTENPLYIPGLPFGVPVPFQQPDYIFPSGKTLEYRINKDLGGGAPFRFLPEPKEYGGILYRPATEKDLEEVYRLRKESFEKSGLTGKGFDTDDYDFFSQIFVAEYGGKVIGTARTIHDSYLGLPIEKDYNIAEWKQSRPKIGEIGRLAIDESKRGTSCLFGILNLLYEYAKLNRITDYFASARPHHAKAYRCVNMVIINEEHHHNSSVNVISNLLRWEIASVNTKFIKRMLGKEERLS
jgi:hypothetical protein